LVESASESVWGIDGGSVTVNGSVIGNEMVSVSVVGGDGRRNGRLGDAGVR